MNEMERDMAMSIKHLTRLLEEAKEENRQLREELNMTRGLLWMKNTGKSVADRTFEKVALYEKAIMDALGEKSSFSVGLSGEKIEPSR